MNSLDHLLNDLADLSEQSAKRIRLYLAEQKRSAAAKATVEERVLAKARELHPTIGTRQEEIIRLIASQYPEGVGTGYLTKTMNYEQPNVYLTLQALMRQGLVNRDDKSKPHKYFLGRKLTAAADGEER
jgi:predicted transcriptional regulator